jgi:uncharacterized protein (DUF488 family)
MPLPPRDIGYQHFIRLGTPKEGRQGRAGGDGALMRRIYCDEVLATEPAQEAFRDLEALAETQAICLLCFERDPENCHRRVLAHRLAERGFETVDLTVL